MKRSILFTAALWLATTCGVAQAESPPVNATNAVLSTTSSDAEIVQVRRNRRYSYRPSYGYSRPYYYAPYGYRYNYSPYRYGPYYYGTGRYGYYNGGGVRVGPVDVWW
jgi:hypothetical protein